LWLGGPAKTGDQKRLWEKNRVVRQHRSGCKKGPHREAQKRAGDHGGKAKRENRGVERRIKQKTQKDFKKQGLSEAGPEKSGKARRQSEDGLAGRRQ